MKKRNVKMCPKCGAKGHVYNTQVDKNGVLYRLRACSNCRWTWKTAEVDYDDALSHMEDLK